MEYWTSDLHLGHENVLKFCNRPFDTVTEMDEKLLENINRRVKKSDTLYNLGDFAFGSVEKGIKYRKRINCENVFLVYGNHDEKNRSFREFRKAFGKGYCHDIMEIRRDNHLIVMCHYPFLYWHHWDKGAWNLHGHLHNCSQPPADHHMMLDVGVDGHGYEPWSFEEISHYMAPRAEKYRNMEITEKTWCS